MNNSQGLLYVTLFSCSWAVQTIINKVALDRGVEPLSFAYQTLLGAAALFAVYIVVFRRSVLEQFTFRLVPGLVSVGVIGAGLGTILTLYGLQHSASVNFGFLIKSGIVFSVLLAALFLGEHLTKKKVLYIALLLVGAYLLSTNGKLIYPHYGDVLIVAAAFCFASANVIAKILLGHQAAELVAFFRVLFGGVVVLLLAVSIVPTALVVGSPAFVVARSLFVFTTALYLNKTIQATSVSYLTMMSMMYPVLVAVLGIALLGERLSGVQLLGGVIIIVAVIAIQRTRDAYQYQST